MKPGFFKIIVSKEQNEMRLDMILGTIISRRKARRLLKAGAVFVNKKRVRRASKPMYEGMEIKSPFFQQPPPPKVDWKKQILFENRDLLVINKPELWPVAPTPWGETGTITHELEKEMDSKLIVVQRLDFHTTGTMIFAKSTESGKKVTESFKNNKGEKIYMAITPKVDLPLGKIQLKMGPTIDNSSRFHVSPQGKQTITEILSIKEISQNRQLLSLKLHTGRTHQIRVFLSHLKASVVGDPWYDGELSEHMFLHSTSLKLSHKDLGDFSWESPLPQFWNDNYNLENLK
jgi:23S rRNA pseudouridine1911/1915/1917 synthase